ncbi:hypothetical protein G1K75_02775 [Tenacibaculum finnmarkense]|uniref:DUF6678 family protein n=1 Tax=Tenacibaculum finnmarkense TaxID=2781243 RepID=UPI00187B6B64|nr:DUF6678 family protein [Tenacibaculum finnmarkense]MBE7691858.1 hypothetical protein [Tenacibaculum finnmarkense genomovar finnmarkense]MCG8804574.1 hypothetical protein [Tenacibaculum finnmarkense]MCG8855686.1 hypothetical protein [Tenacibaculum finnmarkense]
MNEENKNTVRYRKKLNNEISKRTSFMSDTKWKYLFKKMNTINFGYQILVKLLIDDKLRDFYIPKQTDFINRKYLEGFWGTYQLKEIEYIFIPSLRIYKRTNRNEILKPKTENQDIDKLKKCLDTGKKIEYDVTEKGVFIYGYEKKVDF